MELLAFLAVAFCGSLVSSVFGLGSGFIVLSLGSLLLPLKDCIALTTILFTASTFTKAYIYRRDINWRLSRIIALGSIPFAWLGAETLAVIDPAPLKPILAGFIIVSVIINQLGLRLTLPHTTTVAISVSAAYGFLSGLLSSGNPIKALAMERMGFEKQAFIGAMAATALGVNITKLLSYSDNQILRPEHLPTGIGLVIIAIFSALFGKRLVTHIPEGRYKQGLSIILILSASALILK
ncbi:sulfite exporter TauE/SafE family protein [Kiloniella antarctica]|uniref:Probable membrane transporter protein n=1 Tax=Kiloniella antarctica TaxID=1550907 RepID=A0ABW5BEW5_9PROT